MGYCWFPQAFFQRREVESSQLPASDPSSSAPQVSSPAAMGRRKSKQKPPPKRKMTGTLETQFTCPFCNHEKSCDVKM